MAAARKRIDPPKSRRINAFMAGVELQNASPDYHYVLVQNDPETRQMYLALGYEDQPNEEKACTTRGGEWVGDKWQYPGGGTLMRITMAEKLAIEQEGQEQANAVEKKLIDKRGLADPMRGVGRGVNVENDTQRLGATNYG